MIMTRKTEAKKYLIVPIYSTGKNMKLEIKRKIAEIDSGFQKILLVDSFDFGKCLFIDGITQCSEKDHDLYDREILKLLDEEDKNILVLGGGDGYVAEMAYKINPKLNVHVIDLDVEVVKNCEKYLDQKIFANKQVKLYIEDALHHLRVLIKKNKIKLDGIVFDLTDEPVRKKDKNAKESFIKFYEELIDISHEALKEGGWISMQAGASKVIPKYNDAVATLGKLLKKKFKKVERTDIMIPSFGEKNAFLLGRK
jgi:spermidine synthase